MKPLLLPLATLVSLYSFTVGDVQAAVLTQTVAVPPQSVLTNVPNGGGNSTFINVTMNKFDASLGTLTGVQFQLSINYSATSTGGPGGGNWTVVDQFKLDSTLLMQSGAVYNQPFNLGVPVPGTISGVDINAIQVDGPFTGFIGTGTFLLTNSSPNTSFSGGGQTPVSSSLSIIASSSITANYTYNPVPEPSSLAMLGVTFAFGLLRRRRARA